MKTIIIFLFMNIFSVQASLLISPTKIKLEDRERSTKLILINTSESSITYRLSWEQKTVSDKGAYKQLTEKEIKIFPMASKMIRFSPKQVRLNPGERQIVKIAVRRPKDLPAGEYRSHLKLSAIPNERIKPNTEGMSIKANMLFSYVLPVIVRKGKASSNISITNISLIAKQKNKKSKLIISLENDTKYSTTGNLIAYLGDKKGNERVVARLHDFTFYPDKNITQAQVLFFDECNNGCNGILRVAFEGTKKQKGTLFTEKVININADSFK
jgi:fimbrial chaperone protein